MTGKEYTNSELIAHIDEYVHSARNREIIKLKLIDGWTYGELSEKFLLSERGIVKIVRGYINKFHI